MPNTKLSMKSGDTWHRSCVCVAPRYCLTNFPVPISQSFTEESFPHERTNLQTTHGSSKCYISVNEFSQNKYLIEPKELRVQQIFTEIKLECLQMYHTNHIIDPTHLKQSFYLIQSRIKYNLTVREKIIWCW